MSLGISGSKTTLNWPLAACNDPQRTGSSANGTSKCRGTAHYTRKTRRRQQVRGDERARATSLMKIAVCVKFVPDGRQRLDPASKRMDRSGSGDVNPFDLNAVEEAL